MEEPAALIVEAGQGRELLTNRHRIRLETFRCLIDASFGVRGARRSAYGLGNHVQESRMPDRAGELWHTIALDQTQLNEWICGSGSLWVRSAEELPSMSVEDRKHCGCECERPGAVAARPRHVAQGIPPPFSAT